jgi:phospholipid/cholesterol/gamma-HCH transport system permease protein
VDYGLTVLGRRGLSFINRLGGLSILLVRFIGSLKEIPRSGSIILQQIYLIGVKSLPLIVVISIFVGAVSAWQAAYQFKFIGAPLRFLGTAVGKAVVIELAPVLSALVFAGRVGAGIAAEIGTMRVTEQIDALDALGISPIRYLVLPRVLSCLLMLPLLVVFANFVAIMGGLIVSMIGVNISPETFLNGFKESFKIGDFVNGIIKAGVFGLIVGIVGCYEGFRTEGGAEGVGLATTSSVVISSVLILVFNFVFALILFRI